MSPVTVFCLTTQARMCCKQARLATLSAQCASHYGCSEQVWRQDWVPRPSTGGMGDSWLHITCHKLALWVTSHFTRHGAASLFITVSLEQVSKQVASWCFDVSVSHYMVRPPAKVTVAVSVHRLSEPPREGSSTCADAPTALTLGPS